MDKARLRKLAIATVFTTGCSFLLAPSWSSAGTEQAKLSSAPAVPQPITRSAPTKVVVKLEAHESVGMLADGVQYKFWSFNDTVPGPMIRVREGDTVELHLKNHKGNAFPHNIDLHAVNGPGGGAGVTLVAPGQTSKVTFKALAPGLFIYHCASPIPNIPTHIANGMYGLILVEPEAGLPKVDKEFYILQSEFFTKKTGEDKPLEFSMEKGLAEAPDYVVFNGRQDAVTGEGPYRIKVGETVRIYFGNIGPNSHSSFHIIGEIFDKVFVEGAINGLVNTNVQTTLVPSAGSTIVEFKADVPGTLILVDHSIFRVAKGAIGFLTVEGPENPSVFSASGK